MVPNILNLNFFTLYALLMRKQGRAQDTNCEHVCAYFIALIIIVLHGDALPQFLFDISSELNMFVVCR